jgi:cytidylate kinase
MGNEPVVTITISQQMDSGGSYVGRLVARRLGFRYLDREILYEAAKRLGTDERFLADRDQKSSGFLDNFLRTLPYGTAPVAIPPAGPPISDSDLFSLECTIMKEIARRESSVIVGRGAFHVLKDLPGTLRIFMHAPLEFRTKRIMQVQGLTDVRQAESELRKSDQRKSKFVWDMLRVRWADATSYHLCIDTSIMDFDSIAQLICQLAESKKQTLTA